MNSSANTPDSPRRPSSSRRDLLTVVRRAIADRLDEPPSLPEIADLTGMSVRSVQRRLTDEGTTYSRLIRDLRLQAARRMLESSGCSVTRVAMDVGYADAAHFSRAFRAWTGQPPSVYKATRRKSSTPDYACSTDVKSARAQDHQRMAEIRPPMTARHWRPFDKAA